MAWWRRTAPPSVPVEHEAGGLVDAVAADVVESRQDYTSSITSAFQGAAEGVPAGSPAQIAALEAAASLYAAAFASAVVTPDRAANALTASVRAHIGRRLIRHGESWHEIRVREGRLRLDTIGYASVLGPADEARWVYEISVYGPSGTRHRHVGSAGVLHCRYSVDHARPWLGIGPMSWASETGRLAAHLEQRLSEEAGGSVAHVLPVPADGGGDALAQLRTDLASAQGKTSFVETTSAAWGDGKASAPASDWKPRRLGADPPDVLRNLRTDAAMSVLSACGVPVSLVTDADGTSQREAWRRFAMGSVEPLLAQVADEVESKLDVRPEFDLRGLWAHDVAGRASAFKALVTGGMDIQAAAAASGVLSD